MFIKKRSPQVKIRNGLTGKIEKLIATSVDIGGWNEMQPYDAGFLFGAFGMGLCWLAKEVIAYVWKLKKALKEYQRVKEAK